MSAIESFRPLGGLTAEIVFTDGTRKTIDLSPYMYGPIFEAIRKDASLFAAGRVDPEIGTIVWPGGADLCPDTLHDGLPPARLAAAERA